MKNKGITLVALIITIIVLLILATVSISLVINTGILNKAQHGVDKYSEEEEFEQVKLAVASAMLKGNGFLETENLNTELQDRFQKGAEQIGNSKKWCLKLDKNYTIYENGNVEENESLLPEEYQQVEYIESIGRQWIDTKVVSSDQIQTNFEFEYTCINSSYNRIFGSAGSAGSQYGVRADRTNQGYFYGELPNGFITTLYSIMLEAGKRYKIKFNENHIYYINNISVSLNHISNSIGWQNIYLFTHNGINQPSNIKLYSCLMFDNGNEIRNYIPCYSTTTITDVDGIERPAGTVGMYDTVEGKLYVNKGTGTFGYGMEDGTYVAPTNN